MQRGARQLHHRRRRGSHRRRRGSHHRRRRRRDGHRSRGRRRRGLMCPEQCPAYAIPAMQRRVDVHDDPVPAARRVGERVPAPGTGPGGLRLDVTRVMSGHDDPGMRYRPDPHSGQRPGDSMPAGVHAAPERRRWCRGGGGGRRGGCRVRGRVGGRSRAAACSSGQAHAGNNGSNDDPLRACGDRIPHEVLPLRGDGGGLLRSRWFRSTLSTTDAGGGRFILFPSRSNMGIRLVTCEFSRLGGLRVFIDQTRSASSTAELIFGTKLIFAARFTCRCRLESRLPPQVRGSRFPGQGPAAGD